MLYNHLNPHNNNFILYPFQKGFNTLKDSFNDIPSLDVHQIPSSSSISSTNRADSQIQQESYYSYFSLQLVSVMKSSNPPSLIRFLLILSPQPLLQFVFFSSDAPTVLNFTLMEYYPSLQYSTLFNKIHFLSSSFYIFHFLF